MRYERGLWAAAIGAAALVGFWFGRGRSPEPAPSMAVPTVVTAATAESPAKEFVPAALPVAAPEKKSAPDEAAMTERRRASEDIVANALALGRWSDADADALVFASQTLPIEEQHALQLRVARAINEDRLKFAE